MTLLALDRHWSSHLAQMRWNRDRLALIGLVGKNPLAEFFCEAGDEFDRLPSRVEDQAGAFPISRSRAHTHRRHGHPLQTVPSAGLIERPQEKNRVDALR